YFIGGIHPPAGYPGTTCQAGDPAYDNETCAKYFMWFNQFDEATNGWSVVFDPATGRHSDGHGRHGDSVLTLDPSTGDLYTDDFIYPGNPTARFSCATKSWDHAMTGLDTVFPGTNAYSQEWFPDYNGMVVMAANIAMAAFYDATTGSWTSILQ